LEGYQQATTVILSGSFNGWREEELFMKKTATGWQLPYVLGSGNHEYKFIVDGKWIHDPANPLIVQHDHDKKNSFLIIDPNYTFRVKGFSQAKQVYLAGDFNNWSQNTLAMQKQGDEWIIPVHLAPGKHRYKLLVDGEWQLDPGNKLWEQNEFGTGNSIIWIER
jgi:1,4-alpha-glucan branching enzyme